jgi:hypothetical protein
MSRETRYVGFTDLTKYFEELDRCDHFQRTRKASIIHSLLPDLKFNLRRFTVSKSKEIQNGLRWNEVALENVLRSLLVGNVIARQIDQVSLTPHGPWL